MTAAVLSAVTGRPARGTARRVPALEGMLPTAGSVAVAAALLAAGALPLRDAELALAGLLSAVAGSVLAQAVPPASRAARVAAPLTAVAGAALVHAGTGALVTLFLLLPPVVALAAGAGRLGVLAGVLGSAVATAAPAALGGSPVRGAALLLVPVVAGLTGMVVSDLAARGRSRAEELDVATRMLSARAQTMTSVIDAVTEQSIIGTDRDGVVRVWNPGAEKMLGLPRAAVVRQRSIVDFHLPDELDAAAAGHASPTRLGALVHAAARNGSDVRDWTYVAADGRELTVSVAVTPRTDDDGAHAGWNFVGTDMTEARATERMKDQFVSLISHELRTPLSSILGYLELVLDDEEGTLSAEQRQFLGTVERNAHRLQRLVGDLLFTAQVEAGRFTLQPGDVDLVAVVRAAEESARVAAANGGVEIVLDLPDGDVVVAGDAVRLGQACDNLVSNAVKFTPSGGRVTLSLRTVEHPGAEPVARLAVSDTGVGIPAGEQGELFTRFFRASTARRNAVPGVGLGLTITKAITTAHGGTLDVVSAEGRGTTFTLTLPRT